MDILGKARKLESKIAGSLDKYAKDFVRSGAREPLEIVHAILDAVEQDVQAAGRGTRVFPFNRLDVVLLAPSRDARARLEAIVEGQQPLRVRVAERLRSAGCGAADVVVAVTYAGKAQKHWRTPEFHIEGSRVAAPVAAAAPPETAERPSSGAEPVEIVLTVVKGVADQPSYALAAARIDIGRCPEVRDSRNRLIRTNHVAFTEGASGVNQSVSRQHAHIACEPATGHYRLCDDGSAHGTGIVRGGRTIPVPAGARGVRLRDGDEIVLGEARIRIACRGGS